MARTKFWKNWVMSECLLAVQDDGEEQRGGGTGRGGGGGVHLIEEGASVGEDMSGPVQTSPAPVLL